jgi:hypothetical protein
VAWGACVGGGTAGENAWDLQEGRTEIGGLGCRKSSLGGKCGTMNGEMKDSGGGDA